MKKIIFIVGVVFSASVFSNMSIARDSIVCFPDGQCINVGDPGVHP
ncbi:hypothetical protein [Enterobacter sp. WCHEn045836]|nr:hypothetical protein [Enterobacter sp. WCHEn045836]